MPLYACHRATPNRVYRFPDDVADGGTPSGADVTLWNLPTNITHSDAIVVYEGEILVTDNVGDEVAFFAESTAGGTTPTLTRLITLLSELTLPAGIAINSDGMWVGDNGEVFLLPTSNASETTNADGTVIVDLANTDIIKRFDLHSDIDNIEGLTIVGNNLAVADNTNDTIWYVLLSTANDATSTIVREIVLPPAIGDPFGIAAGMNGNLFVVDRIDNDIYLIPSTKANETTGADGRTIVTLLDSDIIRQFNLPAGLTVPYGLAFKSNQATLTLSTTDTDIRVGEAVDIEIASDIDISNFVASDITVTGGTRGALTINSATSATLRVTAGSAGTMTVAIAEDVVDPGNAAASQDFTVNAAPEVDAVLEITLDATSAENGEVVNATFTFDKAVGSFVAADVDVTTAATKGALTNNGDNTYSMPVTAPATGNGTIQIAVAADVVTPGNNADSASFTYAPPADAVLDITLDATSVENSEIVNALFTFDKAVGGFRRNDVQLTGAPGNARGPLVDNGDNTYGMEITAPATGSGLVEVTVAADRVSPGNNAVTVSFNYAPAPTNTAPAFADASYAFSDVAIAVGTVVGTVVATDADSDTLSYTLTGTDASTFAIDANGEITVAVELTNSQVYAFNVVADDGTDTTSVGVSATAIAPPTPTNNAPAFADASYAFADVGIAVNEVVGTVAATDADNDTLSYSLTGTDADKFDIDSDGEITVAELLGYGESYSINVIADDGTDDTSVSVTIDAETVSPRAPTFVVDSTTEDSATITITAGDDGGESVSDWEYELDGDGTWVSFGNPDLEQTISNLDPDTAYAIKVRGVNSEGDGVASAAVTATTDAAPVALSFGSETIPNQLWVVETAVSIILPEATGGTGDKTYSLSPTMTPAGTTFAAGTRVLAGNPTATFTLLTFAYTATDEDDNTVELTFTIVVSAVIPVASTTSTETTYNAEMGYNVLPESLGALKRVNASGNVESLGNLWYGERPYNVAGARALSFDDELHLIMGYGNANEVLRYNSLASKADNFVHLVFGNKLKYILPAFQPTDNIYGEIAELARMVGATVSFDGKIISVVDRRPFRAKADGSTGTGTGNLDFDSENKAFPSSGYLRIGDEFIGYTGISGGAFTGVTRGALGSEPVNHLDNTGILFVNALFSEREILQINPSTDTTRHHNIIRDGDNLFEVSDETNIAQYRKQPYTLDLGLTRNEDAWVETMFAEYLLELKNLGTLITLLLRPRKKPNALDLGQWIGLRYGSLTYALRIESISYHSNMVEIKGRTVEA